MSFWSVPSKSRRRAPSPDSDMFFDTASNFARSNLADRLGSSVFDDFPASRRSAAAMRNFPDQMPFGPSATGSLHRHHHHPRHHAPSWLSSEDFADSRESPPRHSAYQRADSGGNISASRATPPASRQDSQHGSRSSTPESTGSAHSHRSRASATSTGTDEGGALPTQQQQFGDDSPLEEHPGVTARNGRQSFTARRQPKVHHIPIHVEPRDGSSTPVVLTPPVDGNSNDYYQQHQHPQYQQQPSESPPVTRSSSQTGQEAPVDGIASSSSQSSVSGGGANTSTPTPKTATSPPVSKSSSGSNANAATSSSASPNSKKPPPVRAKTKMAADGGGHRSPVHHATKPVVPEPVFPTSVNKPAVPEPEATPKQQQPTQRKTPLDVVNDVLEDVAKLREVVAQFDGQKGDKRFLYLDEMLTRNLIRLDNITPDGNEEVRLARRGAVLAINDCLALLDNRAAMTGAGGEVNTATTASTSEAMQADGETAEMKDESQQETRVDDASAMEAECTISFGGGNADNQSTTTDTAAQESGEKLQSSTTPMDTDDGSAAQITDVSSDNPPTSVDDNKVLEQSSETSANAETKTDTVEAAGCN